MEEATTAPRGGSPDLELGSRILVAAPIAAVAAALIALGGPPFAVAVAAIAALAAWEMLRLLAVSGPVRPAAVAAAAALVAVAYWQGRAALVPAVAAGLALLLVAGGLAAPPRQRARMVAGGLLAVVWVGGALSHGVMLRELPHGGALVTAALLATFVGDTAAHLIGATFGRRRLAPAISPSKTVAGLLAGIAVGTATVLAFAAGWHEWLALHEALVLGFATSLAAPAGDLCESLLKRSAGVKDSGDLLGPHGGVLDRIDAVLFTSVAAYYVALWML